MAPPRAALVAGLALLALGSGGLVPLKAQRPGSVADRATVAHVLSRVTYGARAGDVDRVQAIGLDAWLDDQLHPERIDDRALDARLATFETLTMSSEDLAARYFLPALEMRRAAQAQALDQPVRPPLGGIPPGRDVLNELMQARMLRAVLSERQLQEVLTDFWFNHFNVFAGKGQVRQYLTAYERDAIRPHVLGRFRTLLGAVAHSPAMLIYLDNAQSAASTLRLGRRGGAPGGLNENYARELMELHTLGVDGGYTQQDVTELARILTGWTIDRPRLGGPFLFRPVMHDAGTKRLLGVTFRADGEREGERALDLLAAHPSTARHLARKLVQRFVSDDPPASLVERVATVFLKTDGDLREVTRTILTSRELLAADMRRRLIKTPLEFVASVVRVTEAVVENAQPLVAAVRTLGMGLYQCQPPTGYSTTADAWVNTGALLNRMNIAVELVSTGRVPAAGRQGAGQLPPRAEMPSAVRPAGRGRGPGSPVSQRSGRPVAIDLARLAPDTSENTQAAVIDRLLGGQASDATRRTLGRAGTPAELVALALGSPDFQRR